MLRASACACSSVSAGASASVADALAEIMETISTVTIVAGGGSMADIGQRR